MDTISRVEENTDVQVNEGIRRGTQERVLYSAVCGRDAIDQRLAELDREWDIERTLQANAGAVILSGMALAALRGRRWLLLSTAAAGFLVQHAVQGWCPPLGLFRRLGVRTANEIEKERYALKALRGDFRDLPENMLEQNRSNIDRVLDAVGL